VVEFYAWAVINGAVPEGFAAGKRGLLQGKGTIQTESSEFNKKVWADCKDPEAGKNYITPERQEALLQLVKFNGAVYGKQEDFPAHVLMSRSGYKVRFVWLEERLEVLLKTARAFDNAG
jgi:hypothetical protein